MRTPRLVGLAVVSITIAACGGGRRPVEINPQEQQVVASRWNATLATPPELAGATQVKGTGWMAADPKDPNRTRAHVSVTNAVPGGEHPWHVHVGRCGQDQGIFGPADAYLFGHLGDGNVHVNVVGPPADDDRVDEAVLRLVAQHGGSISAEHGIGRAKQPWLALSRSATELVAFRAIKDALDPQGILNPGVLLPA